MRVLAKTSVLKFRVFTVVLVLMIVCSKVFSMFMFPRSFKSSHRVSKNALTCLLESFACFAGLHSVFTFCFKVFSRCLQGARRVCANFFNVLSKSRQGLRWVIDGFFSVRMFSLGFKFVRRCVQRCPEGVQLFPQGFTKFRPRCWFFCGKRVREE